MTPEQTYQENVIVWIVEDHDILRQSLRRLCQAPRGLDCRHDFGNAEAMLKELKNALPDEKPQVLLLDVGLPPGAAGWR